MRTLLRASRRAALVIERVQCRLNVLHRVTSVPYRTLVRFPVRSRNALWDIPCARAGRPRRYRNSERKSHQRYRLVPEEPAGTVRGVLAPMGETDDGRDFQLVQARFQSKATRKTKGRDAAADLDRRAKRWPSLEDRSQMVVGGEAVFRKHRKLPADVLAFADAGEIGGVGRAARRRANKVTRRAQTAGKWRRLRPQILGPPPIRSLDLQ